MVKSSQPTCAVSGLLSSTSYITI